jgi:HEAT repeat protein
MSLEHSAAAIPALIHHLQADDSLRVRAMCAYKLGFQRDARILAPLVQALNSPDWKLVTMAIIGLRNLGDSAAAPHLLPVLDHAQWSLRRDACAALLGFGVGDPRILRTLEQLAREPEAVEWDLSAAESVRDLPMMREFAEEGDPEPQSLPTMAELTQVCHVLSPGKAV